MNIRHHRHSARTGVPGARPVRFVLSGPPPQGDRRQSDRERGPLPSAPELTSFVREQLGRLYPVLPAETLDGAAGQGARQALAMAIAAPQAAATLHQLAMQIARSLIALYQALAEQNQLRPVA